jgi:hypothetical protein
MPPDASFPMRRPARGRWFLVLLTVGLCRTMCAAEAGEQPPSAVLDLPREGFLRGRLLDVPADVDGPRKTFLWQSLAFVKPFECLLDDVVGIRFPQPAEERQPAAVGEWRMELADGGQLVGKIEAIDQRYVVMAIGPADAPVRLRVRRDAVRSLFRGEAGATYFVGGGGNVGLSGWQQSPVGAWRDEAGRLASTAPGAMLFRDLRAGVRTRYDITLSWPERPTLRIAMAREESKDTSSGYRLEVRPDGVVAVREERGPKESDDSRADLERCCDLPDRGLTVAVFVDQEAGRLAVMLPDADKPVADLTIPPADAKRDGGFSLAVSAGSAALESLRVSPWLGGSLGIDAGRAGSIRMRDGETLTAVVEGMEPGSGEVAVRDPDGPADGESRRIPISSLDEIVFPAAASTEKATAVRRPAVRATDLFGSRLTGNLQRVEQGVVWLTHPAIDDPISLPIATLATLANSGRSEPGKTLSGRGGRLVSDEGSVWGCLVNGDAAGTGDAAAGVGTLAWRPLGSLNASPLALTSDGRQPRVTITYAEPPRAEAAAAGAVGGIGGHIGSINGRPAVVGLIAGSAARRAGIQPGEVIFAIAPRGDGRFVETDGLSLEDAQHLLRGRVGSRLQLRLQRAGQAKKREVALVRQQIAQLGRNPQTLEQALQAHERLVPPDAALAAENAQNRFGSVLILRTGEALPCQVEAIDDQGVRVQFPESDSVTVGADLVQAVELLSAAGKSVTAEKFRSLTMLPRSQRQQPPTHVLRSFEGDYLRGRLISMDDQTVRIAVEAHPRAAPLAIPRVDVARLIWLHPEALDTPWEPPQPPAGEGLPVEGVAGDAKRLRMAATGIRGNVLLGTSPIIGPCRIDLEKIDRLLIGGAIDSIPRNFPYSQWKLQPAPEPRNLPSRRPGPGDDR